MVTYLLNGTTTLTLTDDTNLAILPRCLMWFNTEGTGNPAWNEQDWSSLTGGGIPFAGSIEDWFDGDTLSSSEHGASCRQQQWNLLVSTSDIINVTSIKSL